jgi:hypothetical protein
MRKLFAVTAVAALMCGSANAASWYVTGTGESRMVMNSENSDQMPLSMAQGDAAPADCPAGHFYENAAHMVVACEGGAQYTMMAPTAGTMMDNGKPYPEGSMMMTPAQ